MPVLMRAIESTRETPSECVSTGMFVARSETATRLLLGCSAFHPGRKYIQTE